MRNKKILLGIGITFIYFIIHIAIINDYGLSWDFHYVFYEGLYHLGLAVPSPNTPPPVPFTPPDPRLTVADPFGPIMTIIPAISYKLFYEKLHLLPFDSAYNLSSILYGSLGVGIFFLLLYEAVGVEVAFIGSLFLALLPNYFGYLHFNMKDVPSAVVYTLSIYTFWKLVQRHNWKYLLLASLSFAWAFNVKINAITIPAVCLLWYLLSFRKNILKKKNVLISLYFVAAPLLAVLVWSLFWKDPIGKLWEIIPTFSHNTLNMPVFINGATFRSEINIPIYYPYLYLAITTPLPILLAFIVGLGVILYSHLKDLSGSGKTFFGVVRRPYSKYDSFSSSSLSEALPPKERKDSRSNLRQGFKSPQNSYLSPFKISSDTYPSRLLFRKTYLLLLLWFFVPLARFLDPRVGAIDGVRHYMEVVFPLCAIAGVGAYYIYTMIGKRRVIREIRVVGIVIIFVLLIKNIIYFHPYQTSYFNSLVGGIRGVPGKYDIDFWGTPQKEAMLWLNQNAPQNSSVNVIMAQASAGVYLRSDLLHFLNTKGAAESDYVVILNRQSFWGFIGPYLNGLDKRKVVYTREIDGIPLVWIYQNQR